MSTERLLVAAGFQMKVADTPARLAQVESLPQRKLTRVPYKGESRFVYADEQFCECLYAGTEKAYDRYQRSLRDQRVADEQREASDEQLEASINWGEWGGWGPWW